MNFTEKQPVLDLSDLLDNTISLLALNTYFIKQVGLKQGKMGMAILLLRYARHTARPLYKELGENLIDELLYELGDMKNYRFHDGLSGIAWGIRYLTENHFVDGEEVLAYLDELLLGKNTEREEETTDLLNIEWGWHCMLSGSSLPDNVDCGQHTQAFLQRLTTPPNWYEHIHTHIGELIAIGLLLLAHQSNVIH